MTRVLALTVLTVVACARPPAPVQQPPDATVTTATTTAEPPVVTPPPAPAPAPVPEFLQDDVGERHHERATITRFDAISLTADAPLVKHGSGAWDPGLEVVVLASAGDRVRVVDSLYDMRIALYVARSDLADRVIGETPLVAAPKVLAKPGADGAYLLGGAAPKLGKRSGDWVFVEMSEPGVRVEGWLPTSAFGPIYTPTPFNPLQGDLLLERSTTVKTAAGKVVAHLTVPEFWLVIKQRGEPGGSWRDVEVRTEHLRIQGRIAAKSVRPEINGSILGSGASGVAGRMHTNYVELPARTVLHRTPDGEVLAVRLTAGRVPIGGARQGVWHEVSAPTAWGDVTLWIVCPAFRRAPEGPNFACTTADDPERIEQLPRW